MFCFVVVNTDEEKLFIIIYTEIWQQHQAQKPLDIAPKMKKSTISTETLKLMS